MSTAFNIVPSVGVTLVVSPLVALMEDQTLAMNELGVPAAMLSSSTSPEQVLKISQFETLFIYI